MADKNYYGKIDFYSMKGKVMETIYYETKEEYNKEIRDSCEIGRPINPKILSNNKLLETDMEEEEGWGI